VHFFPLRVFIILFALLGPLSAESNTTAASKIIQLEDTSGLSDNEVRDIAEVEDKMEQITPALLPITPSVSGTWETLAPDPKQDDWVRLTSGEWLRGTFKSLYAHKLEFDSKKLDQLTFDLDDIAQLRTFHIVTLNIQTEPKTHHGLLDFDEVTLRITGILRMKGNHVKIIQGDGVFECERSQLVSIAQGGDEESQLWAGKLSLSLDLREGNTQQRDFTAQAFVERRSATTRLRFDYLGNISEKSSEETSNNHRLNEKFDLFLTRYFFVTPLSFEYYRDPYQNIASQWTLGAGVGYTLIDHSAATWDLSIGPGWIQTHFNQVKDDTPNTRNSWAMQLRSLLDLNLASRVDLTCDYRLTWMDEVSGSYRHHLVTQLENKLASWLDLDLTFVWDYLQSPAPDAQGTAPKQNDYQFLVGMGIDF